MGDDEFDQPELLGKNSRESSIAGGRQVDWQTAMKRAIRCTTELRQRLNLPANQSTSDESTKSSFPTFVPLEFLARIQPGNEDDPLLRQVLPIAAESAEVDGYTADPVGDLNALPAAGVLHKYNRRALMITTSACGIHCRYCFRREFPYSDSGSQAQNWQPSLDYLRQHSEIDEVILSGGDPLTLVDDKLFRLISQLESIPHVRRLRIHSRMPIVIPQRVTSPLVDRLRKSRLATWMVVHANHPAELDEQVIGATDRLIDAGIPVLNQAVLLRGVNDDADTLEALCRKLANHRVQPYYLHQLDRVRGAAHFEVPEEEGLRLIEELRRRLPGYAVPNYVSERAGEPSKTPIA